MKNIISVVSALFILVQVGAQTFDGPLSVHPENGRYFTDNSGKAIYLTGSHTWETFQEINVPDDTSAFDWKGYLEMMTENHHNFSRLWIWEQAKKGSWTKDEIAFSPLPHQTNTKNGKKRYDLSKWNEAYFNRLRQRVKDAEDSGIYVSIMLFQGWSLNKLGTVDGDPWPYHPFNPVNNVNGVGKSVTNNNVDDETIGTLHAMNNGDVLEHQEAFVKKVLETLNGFDNVLYEILNEGGTKDWQYHMVDLIKEIEKTMPKQHPVGMTHAVTVNPPMFNDDLRKSNADWISPTPEPLAWMYTDSDFLEDYQNDVPATTGEKVVILDTDHLWGHGRNYSWAWKAFVRGYHPIFMDAWEPIPGEYDEKSSSVFFAGGVTKNSKDYPDWEPLRKNMGHILRLAERLDLAKMTPQNQLSSTRYCLGDPGEAYVIYMPEGRATSDLRNAKSDFTVEWFIPTLARTIKGTEVLEGGNFKMLRAPYTGDAVLYLRKQ